jgi:hypothetical protein
MFGPENAQPILFEALKKMEESLDLLDRCNEHLIAAQLSSVIDGLKCLLP